ncbi:uncharacterized protein Tco025E_04477 [Trypanosoma conorhini]|uniref:PDZ domain-containing protein n=1 Tax=Trypanosoma conorhini TaxID=83891 RepID=A0A422PM02_9TRYP|nr:uncharacterized protein Tco025E_04477 [Trypanosoma conorhini]RNF18735.1 hypothetical protein Tco025E_04477 [Trypanosoma conorhini]
MTDALINPKEFQELIGVLMKEKYAHEQCVADRDLSRHRQRTERSRSASQTPDKRRSFSNASLGSRAANRRNGSVRLSRRPPCVPPSGGTPNAAAEASPRSGPNNSHASSDVPSQHGGPSNASNKERAEPVKVRVPESFAPQLLSNDSHPSTESATEQPKPSFLQGEEGKVGPGAPLVESSQKRRNIIQSPSPDHDDTLPVTRCVGKHEPQLLQSPRPLEEASRCALLEAKLRDMQETVNKLTCDIMLLAVKQANSDGMVQAEDSASQIPGNLKELGASTEEKFLTVVIALAKRVRRLEEKLEASMQQVRVLEAAAIERDMKLNRTKVGRDELEGVVKALSNTCVDLPNGLKNLYRIWGLDQRRVQHALESSNPASCVDLLLGTPPFTRVLRLMMDKNAEILSALHGQQAHSLAAEGHAYDDSKMPPSRHDGDFLTAVQNNPIPLHEQLLGIYLTDEEGLQGVRVISVPVASPAARALRNGDVIVQVNHVTVHSVADVSYVLSRARPSAPVALSILMHNKPYAKVVEVLPVELF